MVQLYTGAPSLLEWHFIKEAGLDNHLPSLCLYIYIYIYIYIYTYFCDRNLVLRLSPL